MPETPSPGPRPDAPDPAAILGHAGSGDADALDQVVAAVYEELKGIARAQRLRWEGDYTLDTTALVHEAYLKLVKQDQAAWQDRAHFLRVASTAMRHLLVNYAERRRTGKRGGGTVTVPLDDANPIAPDTAEEILALDEALARLQAQAERQSRVVECRFFGGLTLRETAAALGVSVATVQRDWLVASAWLRRDIEGEAG